jgi:hypothetical protein
MSAAQWGLADTELGIKYRFIEQDKTSWAPSISIYPLLEVPTGNAARGLGTGRTHAFVPIWIQKDFGEWTTFGGGGYWTNPGRGNKNHWFVGWVLPRVTMASRALNTCSTSEPRISTDASTDIVGCSRPSNRQPPMTMRSPNVVIPKVLFSLSTAPPRQIRLMVWLGHRIPRVRAATGSVPPAPL